MVVQQKIKNRITMWSSNSTLCVHSELKASALTTVKMGAAQVSLKSGRVSNTCDRHGECYHVS